jgi:hypothetical protein
MSQLNDFRQALTSVNNDLFVTGKVTAEDFQTVTRIARNPLCRRNGRQSRALTLLHRQVEALYREQHPGTEAIDWAKVRGWLRDNWITILKMIVRILMFVLL